jgi:condensin complex subunit 1
MIHLLELDLSRIWKLPYPEENFINLFSKTAYQILENPNNAKNKVIKRCLFILIATLIKKYNQTVGVTTALIHLLHNYEHLAVVVVELMETLCQEYECSHMVGDVVREIGRMNPKEFARDSSGVKNISTFIANLAEKLPLLMIPTLSVLLPHLDGEVCVVWLLCGINCDVYGLCLVLHDEKRYHSSFGLRCRVQSNEYKQ